MSDASVQPLSDVVSSVIEKALATGADAADAVLIKRESSSVSVRGGETEDLNRAEARDLGLRVLIGQSQAIVSSSKFDEDELNGLAERAVAMAKLAPADPNAGLAEAGQLASDIPVLDLADDADPTSDELLAMANEADAAGLAVAGVTASTGAGASASRTLIVLGASNGFSGHYQRTGYGVSAAMIGGDGTSMERDYDYSSKVHFADLAAPQEIGRNAGERVVKRLNARKVSSQAVPVVFDQRIAGSLVGHLAGAVNGAGVARGTSFLKDQLGEAVFAKGISVVDDARLPRGHSSKPFDAEGLATGRLAIIEDGQLKSWLLDLHSARQLGLPSTGHAGRSPSGPPSPGASNLNLMAGTASPQELMADISQGFLVCEMIGMGVNGTTGDYSRGAAGYWIENGEVAYPVSEITIAGNLKDMFKSLSPANDLEIRGSVNAPTCRIEGMTIAGV
ncbi:MAG: TldD/PmbA family protein [Rhizobiales bacterium]|nr:TldD/PmbA family protein [Hyphomicrobiales bacterium]